MGEQCGQSLHQGFCNSGPEKVSITSTHAYIHSRQLVSILLDEKLSDHILWDLTGSDAHVLESSELLSAVDKDIRVSVGRRQTQTRQDLPCRVVIVKDRQHLALMVGFCYMVHPEPKVPNAKLG
jgi:hypothetical protein